MARLQLSSLNTSVFSNIFGFLWGQIEWTHPLSPLVYTPAHHPHLESRGYICFTGCTPLDTWYSPWILNPPVSCQGSTLRAWHARHGCPALNPLCAPPGPPFLHPNPCRLLMFPRSPWLNPFHNVPIIGMLRSVAISHWFLSLGQ